MTLKRLSQTLGFALNALVAVYLVASLGCGSNAPSIDEETGGKVTAGSGATTTTAGAGGATTTATTGTGGTSTKTGGGGTTASTGGTTATASAGTSGEAAGGGGDTAGASGESAGTSGEAAGGGGAGGSSGDFSPLCSSLTTEGGAAPTKGGACTANDPQQCYKACGPENKGFKSETCTSGAYVEQSGCTFPDADYTCYKIPETLDATCPTDAAPQHAQPCTVNDCVVCNYGGATIAEGKYKNTSGEEKVGFCVCIQGTSARKWSCASATAWPCPAGQGC
jgi:hypothetical protein